MGTMWVPCPSPQECVFILVLPLPLPFQKPGSPVSRPAPGLHLSEAALSKVWWRSLCFLWGCGKTLSPHCPGEKEAVFLGSLYGVFTARGSAIPGWTTVQLLCTGQSYRVLSWGVQPAALLHYEFVCWDGPCGGCFGTAGAVCPAACTSPAACSSGQ